MKAEYKLVVVLLCVWIAFTNIRAIYQSVLEHQCKEQVFASKTDRTIAEINALCSRNVSPQ